MLTVSRVRLQIGHLDVLVFPISHHSRSQFVARRVKHIRNVEDAVRPRRTRIVGQDRTTVCATKCRWIAPRAKIETLYIVVLM